MCCRKIPVFANESGDGAFEGSLRGISGHLKWVEMGEHDAKSWNGTPVEDIIELTDRRCDQHRNHLGNIGLNEPLSEKELEAVRRCLQRGNPLANVSWVQTTARRLGLESTLCLRGHPEVCPVQKRQNNCPVPFSFLRL